MRRTSPSGRPTCPPAGPLDAQLVIVGESPAKHEINEQQPFVGQSGKLLTRALLKAGFDRKDVRFINAVPCQPHGNEFANHTQVDYGWGLEHLNNELSRLLPVERRIVVCLGANPMRIVMGINGISDWRGSLLPPATDLGHRHWRNEYWTRLATQPEVGQLADAAHMASFHPAAVLRRMEWHVWLNRDLARAKAYLDGNEPELRDRTWHVEAPEETRRLIYDVIMPHEHLVAIDTEMSPSIVSLVTEEEVHAFEYRHDVYHDMLRDLMASPGVLKVAHNQAHDWRQFEKVYGIPVEPPYYDTLCLAHIMEPSGDGRTDQHEKSAGRQVVGKKLSPHIATAHTGWPFHKWLEPLDPHWYCGMDTVVCYDAYWHQVMTATPTQMQLAEFDSRFFRVLFDMQRRGILVDTDERQAVMAELRAKQDTIYATITNLTRPIIKRRLGVARKPHLFYETRQCQCCGGGSNKLARCWSCAGFERAPTKAMLVERGGRPDLTKAQLVDTMLDTCKACAGLGHTEHWLPINLASSDQVADLFYRMMRVPPRTFEGKETTRIEQMERMLEPGGYLDGTNSQRKLPRRLLELYRQWNHAETDYRTAERITPGADGRVRCNFDPWYTPTGRVASRESLLDEGTNLQNIPKEARRLLIPSPDHLFCYPDYRQVEGRSIAVITQAQALLDLYADEHADSHQFVANMVSEAGAPITRDQAKRTFFAVCYGVEAPHLAAILGVKEHEARAIIRAIFKAFPGVHRMRQQVERSLRQTASITTRGGWTRRWLGHTIHTRGKRRGQIRDKIIKEALATEPQWMGARVLAEGIIALTEQVAEVKPVLHVHDATAFEVPTHLVRELSPRIEQAMGVTLWDMFFPVDLSYGPNLYVASISDKDKLGTPYEEYTVAALTS